MHIPFASWGLCAVALVMSGDASANTPTGVKRGFGLSTVASQALTIENRLFQDVNRIFRGKKSSLRLDEALSVFSRKMAERAARGQLRALEIQQSIETQNLTPHGFYFRLLVGDRKESLLKTIRSDRELRQAIEGEFSHMGIGAFHAPADPPFFQVMVLLSKKGDPRAGMPGLSKSQTDPAMREAVGLMRRRCYDPALKADPNMGGQVFFELKISGDGSVSKHKLIRGLDGADFDRCLLGIVASLRFPPPYKGVPVTLRHPVSFSPPQGDQVVGRLSDGEVRVTFSRARADFLRCYSRRKENQKNLEGRIETELKVSPEGEVLTVKVVNNMTADSGLEACVVDRINRLKFPKPKFGGAATVTFPIDFGD